MDLPFPSDLMPPASDENNTNKSSERSERLIELLNDELRARDTINRESQERIDQFIQNSQSELNFDPFYIDFFSESQERIDLLNYRLERLMRGESPSEKEIEELDRRTDAATLFFSGINEEISTNLTKIEGQTNALITKQIPLLIKQYEDELIKNRNLKKQLEDLKRQNSLDV